MCCSHSAEVVQIKAKIVPSTHKLDMDQSWGFLHVIPSDPYRRFFILPPYTECQTPVVSTLLMKSLVALFLSVASPAWAFVPVRLGSNAVDVSLLATPRRNLPKRRRRRNNGDQSTSEDNDDDFWLRSESRPLIAEKSIELGEDYWIDEDELAAELARQEARRRMDPGQIPKEKLWTEILSPYRQNWIGMVTVVVVILATIVTKFPELLQSPAIPIPDL